MRSAHEFSTVVVVPTWLALFCCLLAAEERIVENGRSDNDIAVGAMRSNNIIGTALSLLTILDAILNIL